MPDNPDPRPARTSNVRISFRISTDIFFCLSDRNSSTFINQSYNSLMSIFANSLIFLSWIRKCKLLYSNEPLYIRQTVVLANVPPFLCCCRSILFLQHLNMLHHSFVSNKVIGGSTDQRTLDFNPFIRTVQDFINRIVR